MSRNVDPRTEFPSTSVTTTTDGKPEKEVVVILTLNRQPKNVHELAVYFSVRELLQEKLKDDYRLKGQISSNASEICNGNLKKSFHDLYESFAFSAKKDTLLMEHKMRKLPADSGTAGAPIEFTLSILHDWYPFADERNCFLNKISLEKLSKSWSSNTLLEEPVCRICALYFIKSNKDVAMPELTRDRDSEAAGQDDDTVSITDRIKYIMKDMISIPAKSDLQDTFVAYASSTPNLYHFIRCQNRSLNQAIKHQLEKDPGAREVFREYNVANAIHVLNCIKDCLKGKDFESQGTSIQFNYDISDTEIVDIIKDVLKKK